MKETKKLKVLSLLRIDYENNSIFRRNDMKVFKEASKEPKRKKCETCKGQKVITTYGYGDTVGVEINCPECCDGRVAKAQLSG